MNIPTTVNKCDANSKLMDIRQEIESMVDYREIGHDEAQYMLHCLNIIDTYINRGDAE